MIEFLVGSLAGFVSGITAAMGLGGGSVLIIYLTIFAGVGQLSAQGINLLFFIPIGAVAVFIYARRKIIKFKTILPIIIFGVIGTLVSGLAVSLFDPSVLRKIFGAFIFVYGLFQVFSINKKRKT